MPELVLNQRTNPDQNPEHRCGQKREANQAGNQIPEVNSPCSAHFSTSDGMYCSRHYSDCWFAKLAMEKMYGVH